MDLNGIELDFSCATRGRFCILRAPRVCSGGPSLPLEYENGPGCSGAESRSISFKSVQISSHALKSFQMRSIRGGVREGVRRRVRRRGGGGQEEPLRSIPVNSVQSERSPAGPKLGLAWPRSARQTYIHLA